MLAIEVLETMATAGVQPNVLTYTAVMGSCIAGEEYKEALEVFDQLKGAGITPDLGAYTMAMNAYEKDGDTAGAEAIAAEIAMANLAPAWTPEW